MLYIRRACRGGSNSNPWRSARPGESGKTGIETIQGLNGGLLIETRRRDAAAAEAEDVGGFAVEFRIVALLDPSIGVLFRCVIACAPIP